MSFSSTPVWDDKDALITRAGWKFSSGMLLENADFTELKHFTGTCWFHWKFQWKAAGRLSRKPVLLVTCQPRLLPWLPAPQAAAPSASSHPNQASVSAVGWLGRGKQSGGALVPSQSLLSTEEKVCFLDWSTSKVILTVFTFFLLAHHILTNIIIGRKNSVYSHWCRC